MGRIEELAGIYGQHIATPWQRTVSGAQRVIMVTYDKEMELTLRARKQEFETRTNEASHDWFEIDLTDSFAKWLAADEYREAFFGDPENLVPKVHPESGEFTYYVADQIRSLLSRPEVGTDSVVAVFGVASLFGFARLGQILKLVEGDVRGRLAVFFPGHFESNNYRMLDARDGWNYLAVHIGLRGSGVTT
jgi:hypothetical protein